MVYYVLFYKVIYSFIHPSSKYIFFSTTKLKAKSFEINNIEISKPFQNNFNKNSVIDIGFKKAFSELVNTLVKSSDFKKINKTKLNEIRGMIDSSSIKEEKFIDETYHVKIGVAFNKKKIFYYLEKKISFHLKL